MTQEAETVAVDLDIVSCQTCDAVFIASERRQSCAICGGEATGPYFRFVLDAAGLHLKDGAGGLAVAEAAIGPLVVAEIKERYTGGTLIREEAVAELGRQGYSPGDAELLVAIWDKEMAPEAEAPAAEAPAAEEAAEGEAVALKWEAAAAEDIGTYLGGGEISEDYLRDILVTAGADPEDAAAAVGRLQAVRDLLRELAELPVEVQVYVTDEVIPEEAPEPEGEREPGQKA